ncbi:alanine racemase [Paenibacillus radicis (ex Gao et al. 2016)]|uniref:Alanine racemase n=1 Tax=Paenibacillus radicis (ex Gao et al. 2016) TaxID=1737354 RepID=A0A917HKJ1_9BACL|nr:alanine racemase [Paenibacillus radicis (ex Gao et al. 2016)]GGG81635.1 alanine racemase [Paenibacillus radicis (ex Gao et al. 2016)]
MSMSLQAEEEIVVKGNAPETPCIIIDSSVVDHNIREMAERIRRLGVKLRPHAKTHKLPEMAARQVEAGAVGITVAKLSEAEVMADGGIADIFIAYPIVSEKKLRRAAVLSRRIRLILTVDSLEGARRAAAVAVKEESTFEVRLEIDSGLHRTGVLPENALALAKEIHALEGIRLTGIFTYRGAMLDGKSTMDLRAAGLEEGRLMAVTAQALRAEGLPIADVSVGSTPTSVFAAEVEGVTEVRPGTYIFHDRMQAAYGVCSLEDCAATVWVTVVSRPSAELIVVDGGSKTFATDVQPNNPPLHLQGFGHIMGAPDAVLERMNEEHGMIRIGAHHPYEVGDVIQIIPNHICSTVNLHNDVYVTEPSGALRKTRVAARGMLE